MRELAEVPVKAQIEALTIISKRSMEHVEEMKALMRPRQPALTASRSNPRIREPDNACGQRQAVRTSPGSRTTGLHRRPQPSLVFHGVTYGRSLHQVLTLPSRFPSASSA
jgi:hypothetical protein